MWQIRDLQNLQAACVAHYKKQTTQSKNRLKYTFLQRRHTDGQQAHEDMLNNITNCQRNANQNCEEVSLNSGQNGYHQKVYKQ